MVGAGEDHVGTPRASGASRSSGRSSPSGTSRSSVTSHSSQPRQWTKVPQPAEIPRSAGTVQPSCTFCGYGVPPSVAPLVQDGLTFCSRPCAEMHVGGEPPFAGALGFSHRPVGVAVLDESLPAGLPGDAAVLVAGEEGTRLEGMLLEVVWRALERGERAVVVSVDNPPSALVDGFLAHGWNVLPYLAAGSLAVVDLFTSRLAHTAVDITPENRWADYLRSVLEGPTTVVSDPSDVREVANQLDNALENLRMTTTGVVAVDYLTELATFAQEVRASSLLKELRAQVCKRRHVPLLAGGSRPRREGLYPTDFPHDHEYLFDGIVDLRVNDDIGHTARVPQLSVRKMDDVPADPDWTAYEFRPGRGFVPIETTGRVGTSERITSTEHADFDDAVDTYRGP